MYLKGALNIWGKQLLVAVVMASNFEGECWTDLVSLNVCRFVNTKWAQHNHLTASCAAFISELKQKWNILFFYYLQIALFSSWPGNEATSFFFPSSYILYSFFSDVLFYAFFPSFGLFPAIVFICHTKRIWWLLAKVTCSKAVRSGKTGAMWAQRMCCIMGFSEGAEEEPGILYHLML